MTAGRSQKVLEFIPRLFLHMRSDKMAKDIQYTTVDQQIKKLNSQHLTINDLNFARTSLELFGYSNLIKSYREPYIINSGTNISYRSGVSFEQICSLYMLDKNLRNAVMASMQDLEEHIKEIAASVVAKSFGTHQDDYLAYRNYQNKKKRKQRFTLSGILDTLRKTLDTDKNPIHHYNSNYGAVPPWILFKSIYFSTIVNFIDLFKEEQKIQMINQLYNADELELYNDALCKLMMDTLYICLDYRNIAAHGGRIYNHNSKYKLRFDDIFNSNSAPQTRGFSQLLFLLSLFNYQNPFNRLNSALCQELERHCHQFPQDVTYLGQILNINIVTQKIVYISSNSNKYHRIPHCSGIKKAVEIPLEKAIDIELIPCKRCIKQKLL